MDPAEPLTAGPLEGTGAGTPGAGTPGAGTPGAGAGAQPAAPAVATGVAAAAADPGATPWGAAVAAGAASAKPPAASVGAAGWTDSEGRWALIAAIGMAAGTVLPWAQANGYIAISASALSAFGKDLTATGAIVAGIVALIASGLVLSGSVRTAEAGWRLTYAIASIAAVGCAAIVFLQFLTARSSLGALGGLVSPGIGLFLTGLSGAGGLAVALIAANRATSGPPARAGAARRWRVSSATGMAGWIDGTTCRVWRYGSSVFAAGSGWQQEFPAASDGIVASSTHLELRDPAGARLVLLPASGQDPGAARTSLVDRADGWTVEV